MDSYISNHRFSCPDKSLFADRFWFFDLLNTATSPNPKLEVKCDAATAILKIDVTS